MSNIQLVTHLKQTLSYKVTKNATTCVGGKL